MKYLIPIIFLLSYFSYSQISDGKTVEELELIGKVKSTTLKKMEYEGDDAYFLTFDNLEYQQISDLKTLSFTASDEEFEKFYKFLKSGFETKKQKEISVGDSRIRIEKNWSSLRIYVFFENGTDGWFQLTKRRIDKLFGKR
jgi:DNA-binding transcriptional regulator GbsR (MarR family)